MHSGYGWNGIHEGQCVCIVTVLIHSTHFQEAFQKVLGLDNMAIIIRSYPDLDLDILCIS